MDLNLEALGNLGDFVGGIAVVVTLIYLALQVRQNNEQLHESLTDCLMRIVSDAKQRRLEELATKANDSGLTTPEKEELRTLRRQN